METLLHAGLSNAVSATFLAVLVACLGRVLARRPAILHCLWLLVLLKLVTPPLYQIPIPWPESLSSGEKTAAVIEPERSGAALELLQIDLEDPAELAGLIEREPRAVRLALEEESPRPETDPALQARAAILSAFGWLSQNWAALVGSVWLAGTLATIVISVRRIHRFQLVLREATPGSDRIQSWVDELSAQLGLERAPQVWWIAGKLSPMLWAVGACPRLIIPIELWKGLDERQQGTLLVHELAHLRRGDHRVRIFELAVTALYWWNPVLWWARQALRDVEEQCCDAWVVWAFPEAAKSYAETLLETLDFLNHSGLSEPLLASGFGKVQHLRRRLTMIMSGTTPRLVGLRGTLAALSLGALLLPINASWAQKPEEQKEVRVIVKTDDSGDKVVGPGGVESRTFSYVVTDDSENKVVAPGGVESKTFSYYVTDDSEKDRGDTVVFSAEPIKTQRDTLVLSAQPDQPAKLETGFVYLTDKVESDGKPAEKTEVKVVLTTDDSTVSIAADSLDDALRKITEQIKALKAKAPTSDKEKAQQKALAQVATQLEKILKDQKLTTAGKGDGKGKQAITSRFVVRRDDVKVDLTPEKKAEIDGLRGEVKKLSVQLAEAQRKLAQLEGRSANVKVFAVPAKVDSKAERKTTVVRVPDKLETDIKVAPFVTGRTIRLEPKVVEGIRARLETDAKTSKADEDRISAIEKKLNKVIEALEGLKKSKND